MSSECDHMLRENKNIHKRAARSKTFLIFFKKGIDKSSPFRYNISVATREWRNWQTRTFEGRVISIVRVQVPFLAPTNKKSTERCSFFVLGGRKRYSIEGKSLNASG